MERNAKLFRNFTCLLYLISCPFESASGGSIDTISRLCGDVKPIAEKIRRCLSLVNSGLLDEASKPIPYSNIAFAYFELRDIDHAIEYARKYRDGIKRYYKRHDSSTRCKNMQGRSLDFCVKVSGAQIGYAYRWVGNYELSKAQELALARNYESSIRFAKRAIRSYTEAISFDHGNHAAYARRGELFAEFCKSAEAQADYSLAISIALRLGNERDAREYRDKLGSYASDCRPEYRGRF